MTDARLVGRLLDVIENDIVPKTGYGVAGGEHSGAAILARSDLPGLSELRALRSSFRHPEERTRFQTDPKTLGLPAHPDVSFDYAAAYGGLPDSDPR